MRREYNTLRVSSDAIFKKTSLDFGKFLIQVRFKKGNLNYSFKLFFILLLTICLNSNAQVSTLLNPTYGYTFSNISGSYNTFTGGTVFQSGTSLNTDAVSGAIPLPFPFTFNGIKESTIFISNNGFITFEKAQLTATTKNIISTTVTSGYDGVVSGFGNDLVASAFGNPEIRYGVTANNDFVVQYQDLAIMGKTATRITFQIVLKADGKIVQIVYGPNNTGQALAVGPQVGIRGTSPLDFNNRSLPAGGDWNLTGGTVGSSSSSTMSWLDTSTMPVSGRTFQWVPTAYVPTYLANPFTITQNFSTFINGSGPSNVPSVNWATNGYGNASWQRDDVSALTTTSGWSSTTGAYTPADFENAVGGHSARFHSNATAPQVGYLDYYVNLSGGTGVLTVDFYHINTSGSDILQVFLSTNGGASFAQVGTDLGIATAWTYHSFSLGATTSPSAIIRFKGVSDFGSSDIGIDNVKVSQPLPCLTPTAVTPSNIAGNSATITWACADCTGSFDIEYGAYGHTAGTGTVISNITSPYNLNPPLNSNTDYTVYVRQKCNGTPGLWSDPSDFTTLYACPANLGAGLVNVPALPYTFTNQTTLGAGNNVTTSNPTCIAGSASYYGGEDKTYIFTPVVSGIHTITLTTTTADRSGIMLYQGCPFTPGSSCVGYTQSISGLTRVLSRSLTSGVTYYLVVDNFPAPSYISNYSLNIDSPATCGVPTGLTVTNIVSSKADIAWVAPATVGTAATYDWEIRSSGAGGSGTIGLASSGQTTAPTVSVVNAGGLLPKTNYNLYVKTNCTGSSGPSLWAGPVSFITALDCNAAIPITAGTSVTTGNLATAGSAYNLSGCGFSSAGNEALYTFTSTTAGTYSFNITSLNGGTGFIDSFFKAASLGCGATGWNCIDDNGAVGTDSFTLAANTTYFILLDSEATTGIANHTFNITAPASIQTCATIGTVTATTPVTCFGGNNGLATIALSAAIPSNSAITYTVDGGATNVGTLVAGIFTISGLTAGAHSVVISNTGCSNIIVPVTISGPTSALTNLTTITACNSYLWPVTGQTYTTGGTYTGTSVNVAGCTVNETLVLTINSSTSHTTTATACNSYTWAAPLGNGLTYTSSVSGVTKVSTNAAGCTHTETLNLTINSSTTGTTTASACNSYTWAFPLGNGQSYSTSTTATNVTTNAAGCPHTQTLNLTVTPSTTNGSVTTSICNGGSYTWPANGVTYTTPQTNLTYTSGCNTATLNLAVTTSTTTGSVTTSICAGSSYTWPANGVTYTTPQTNLTYTSGCNTATLNLAVTPSTTTGSVTTSICAGSSYTWPANGVTYTTAQTGVTVVSGCNTATLNLSITPITTNGSVTTSICAGSSYTWPANGVTYTTAQTNLTYTVGCNKATLNLSINNPTSGTTTASACGSYTWALPLGNGQTYTTSTTATNVTTNAAGCTHTQTLNLTINNSTSHTTVASACNSYTWALPLGNGQTYYSSVSGVTNVSTNAAGCTHTETLNLTINSSTTNGSLTISANNSYTWAANGQTYTTSGTYTNTTTNAAGCPNVATLNLTIVLASLINYYQDLDGDGYGNAAAMLSGAAAPANYVTNNTDCDDSLASVNPGAVEILFDGIDNNCNGLMDEGYQLKTKVLASQCGTTLAAIGSSVEATALAASYNITGYRFRVTNGTTIQTIDKTLPYFSLTMLESYNFATTYTVEVQLQKNGIWLGYYGDACLVTTPTSTVSSDSAAVTASQCGTTLATIATNITTPTKTGAKGYKFRITNLRTGFRQEKVNTKNTMALTSLTQYVYGDTYSVEVAVTTGTVYPGYGNVCNVTAPAVPGLSTQCGTTIATKTTNITTTTLNKVTAYNFEVTNMATLVTVSLNRTVNSFTLSLLTNYSKSTQFRVRLKLMTSNEYSDYGPACYINSPAIAREDTPIETKSSFKVSSFPNPFDNTFRLSISESSIEDVSIRVYDMMGKLLEERTFKIEDADTQEIGERLPSGIYLVNVSQGQNTVTKKMIKR